MIKNSTTNVNKFYKKLPDFQVFNRLNPAPTLYRVDKELPRGVIFHTTNNKNNEWMMETWNTYIILAEEKRLLKRFR